MGHLAELFKQATTGDCVTLTPEMLKEAKTRFEEFAEKFTPDLHMSTETESLLNALKWGGMLSVPMSAIVAALMLRGQSKAEKRRKELEEQLELNNAPPPLIQNYPAGSGVEVKAASLEKESGILGWPLAVIAALLAPAGYNYLADKLGGAGIGDLANRAFEVTSNPLTHPLGASAIIGTPVLAGALTHHYLGSHLENVKEERMKREREKAEQEFQQALEAEYQGSKVASMNDAVSFMADAFVKCAGNGDSDSDIFEDPAEAQSRSDKSSWTGSANMVGGILLAALLTLTGATGYGAYQWAKSSDKGRKRSEALEKLVRRRRLAGPQPMTAYRQGEEKTIAEEPI